MEDHEDINLRMAEGQVRMSDDVWIKRMGDISTVPYSMGCGTTRSICYNMGEESIG
jgi:hypothetical protein